MTKTKFGSVLLLFQGILLIFFIVFVDYQDQPLNDDSSDSKIEVFKDLHAMAFIGFGLIITFLRRYTRGMLVHAFLVGAFVIQWSTLLEGFLTLKNIKIYMSIDRMLNADFAVVCVLISFGALVGKCNSLQLLIIAMLETFFYTCNAYACANLFMMADSGRSVTVHLFGAVFGLAVSRMIFSKKVCMSRALSMSSESEMFAFLGTLFLWVSWPSVNAPYANRAAKQRALSNTYFALAASCISSFSFTVLQGRRQRFNVLHLQNATLSGGVAVGAVAAMMIRPWGAIIIGTVAALVSILTYKYVIPKLRRSLKIHDTRGINAVHGLPALVSAIASVIAAALASENTYKLSLFEIYPARAPMLNTTKYNDLTKITRDYAPGLDRTAGMQAVFQFAGIGSSLVLALIGGLITGMIVRIPFFDPLTVADTFDDHIDFEEENGIDLCSEHEFDMDDDEKCHDSLHGKTRLEHDRSQSLSPNGSVPHSLAHSIDIHASLPKSTASLHESKHHSTASLHEEKLQSNASLHKEKRQSNVSLHKEKRQSNELNQESGKLVELHELQDLPRSEDLNKPLINQEDKV